MGDDPPNDLELLSAPILTVLPKLTDPALETLCIFRLKILLIVPIADPPRRLGLTYPMCLIWAV